MPLGDFEREVMRSLAASRHPDIEALQVAVENDLATLRAAGFDVEPVGQAQAEFRRAMIRRGGRETKIEWVHDSAFRFFPVERDLELGWRLNFFRLRPILRS